MKQAQQLIEKNLILLIVLFLCCCKSGSKAKRSAVDVNTKQSFKIDQNLAPLGEKVFAGFTALNNSPQTTRGFYTIPAVRMITEAVRRRYTVATKTCRTAECLVEALTIKAEERKILLSEYNSWISLGNSSGKLKDVAELETDLAAVNHILNTYVGGAPLRYPKIDGGGFSKGDPAYIAKICEKITAALSAPGSEVVFYAMPMLISLNILELNGRDEAARYDPITAGINKEAYYQVRKTEFEKFQYSAIIVPGLGPSDLARSLDSGGARRCVLAAAEYRKKKAPFIIVSGGHVHPDRTPFSEAIEMRKYLVEKLGVPASAVIAEPYARHTTTNVRNGLRIVYAFGMPANKPVMLVSDVFQSSYVMMMKGRFMDEIGFLPYKSLQQDNDRKPYFIPDSAALRRNPYDPLDP
ncbi:MAG: YdcF family protein [Flavitalea sp.]